MLRLSCFLWMWLVIVKIIIDPNHLSVGPEINLCIFICPNKKQIRTHLQKEVRSDLLGMVRHRGLEPRTH